VALVVVFVGCSTAAPSQAPDASASSVGATGAQPTPEDAAGSTTAEPLPISTPSSSTWQSAAPSVEGVTGIDGGVDPPDPAPTAVTPEASHEPGVDVPITRCRNSFGGPPFRKPRPAVERLDLPERLAKRLAVFATDHYRVLAPRSWHCDAAEGANGTGILTVTPQAGGSRAIEYQDDAGTFGNIVDTACPFFKSAARGHIELYGYACPRPPAREVYRRVNKNLVFFKDPRRVSGTGAYSGGRYAAVGAVAYRGGEDRWAAKITCVMSAKHRDVCNAVLEYSMPGSTAH
jgi:hypothetical protein